jgi:hypothetical protein
MEKEKDSLNEQPVNWDQERRDQWAITDTKPEEELTPLQMEEQARARERWADIEAHAPSMLHTGLVAREKARINQKESNRHDGKEKQTGFGFDSAEGHR